MFTIALFSGLLPVYNGRRYALMKLLGGITFLLGCEYGDRSYQCRNIQPFDCYVERNRQICCERCEELRQQMQANGKNLSHLTHLTFPGNTLVNVYVDLLVFTHIAGTS